MIKKTINYRDYDGNERTEDFYFNMSKAELAFMNMSTAGGFQKFIERIVAEQDVKTIVEIFQDLLRRSYGKKSDDGRKFVKSPEIYLDFEQTEAYSELIVELISNPDAASAFINGILPAQLAEEFAEINKVTAFPANQGSTPVRGQGYKRQD